jgi:hypothetical protein
MALPVGERAPGEGMPRSAAAMARMTWRRLLQAPIGLLLAQMSHPCHVPAQGLCRLQRQPHISGVIWVRDIVTILGTVGGLGAVTWTFVGSGIELPLLGPLTRRKRRGP